jgi:hypothetical protein
MPTPSGTCTDPGLAIFGLLFVFPLAFPGWAPYYHTTWIQTDKSWITDIPEVDLAHRFVINITSRLPINRELSNFVLACDIPARVKSQSRSLQSK